MQLIEEDVIDVLMPHVIAHEWRTQQLERLRKQFQRAEDALKELVGSGHLDAHDEFENLKLAAGTIKKSAADLEDLSQKALDTLLEQLDTEVIPIANEHGSRVMAGYFKGSSPFSGIKNRQDIPDAFVYETVVDLAPNGPTIVAVTSDGNLRKQLSQVPGVICVEKLEQLVESPQVKEATAQKEATWRERLPLVVEAVKQLEADVVAHDGFENTFVDALAGKDVEHHSIPSDNHNARVSMVGTPDEVEIDWDSAEDYGPGVLRVPFTCRSEVLLDFSIYSADAYSQPEFISISWADPEDQHYFDAQAHANVNVEGFLSVTVHNWGDGQELDVLEVTVDIIENANLVEDDIGQVLHG